MALAVRQAEDKATDVAKAAGQAEAVAPQYAIVNMSSTVGVRGMPDIVRYATAKAGILGMTRQCAFDLGKHNIRCRTASQITSASYPSSQYTLISSASPLLGKSCNSQQEKSWLNVYQLRNMGGSRHAFIYMTCTQKYDMHSSVRHELHVYGM